MLPRYLIKSTVRMVFHVTARLSVPYQSRTCRCSRYFEYHIKLCTTNDKNTFKLPHKDLHDVHPSTTIDFYYLLGQRTEVMSTEVHSTSHAARAKETLHASALKEGRRQSAAFKLREHDHKHQRITLHWKFTTLVTCCVEACHLG